MHGATRPHIQRGPALCTKAFQNFNISLKNGIRLGEHRYRAVDALLTQEMQRRVRRSIGAVGDIVQLGTRKLKLRMEKSHLQ